MEWLGFGIALIGCGGAVSAIVIRRLLTPGLAEDDLRRVEQFSAETYNPMARLLAEEDVAFLRSQPGYVASLERRLRVQRVAIYRAYLAALRRDFEALHRAARTLVAYSTVDEPALVRALAVEGIRFWYSMGVTQTRLVFYRWGLHPPRLSAHGLLAGATRVQDRLRVLTARPAVS